jgi:hypothetical protein
MYIFQIFDRSKDDFFFKKKNEVDQMRKKVNETEMKNARLVHDVRFQILSHLTSILMIK